MNIPCPNAITCPGTDDPVANFSSEAPDQELFLATNWGDPVTNTPPLGPDFPGSVGCVVFAISTVSLASARHCASATQILCTDGEEFSDVTPVGCVVTPSNPNTPLFPVIPHPITDHPRVTPFGGFSCSDSRYAFTLSAAGLFPPFTFEVVDGALPPGLVLDPSGILSGIPTVAGDYGFTIVATDKLGEKSVPTPMTFSVLGIITDEILPDGVVGTPYSLQLVGGGGASNFEITDGTLPDGLTMDEFGLISGTPTTVTPGGLIVVTVTDDFFNTCDKDFVIKAECACGS